MRVFEIFTYNLNSIKFKDTKDYFDGLLERFDMSYTDIMFSFTDGFSGELCQKIKKTFPALSEYILHIKESERYFKSAPDNCFTSIRKNNGKIEKYLKAGHNDDFGALLKKIPRPINFGFMGVVLDNVNWYKDEFQKPVMSLPNGKYDILYHKFPYYFSNSVRFFKEFDFGNKLNLVEIMIERKAIKDSLTPCPTEFEQFLNQLGKPKYKDLKCVFDDDENKKWENASEEFNTMLNNNNKNLIVSKKNLKDEEYLVDWITPVSGFSPKAVFNKTAKNNGYTNFSFENGFRRYKKSNSNNHTFIVELSNPPFSSFFSTCISVVGYNFNHILFSSKEETVKDETTAKMYAEKIFEISSRLEKEYEEKLLSLYGKTPGWYEIA